MFLIATDWQNGKLWLSFFKLYCANSHVSSKYREIMEKSFLWGVMITVLRIISFTLWRHTIAGWLGTLDLEPNSPDFTLFTVEPLKTPWNF